jgi:hypothetical protein
MGTHAARRRRRGRLECQRAGGAGSAFGGRSFVSGATACGIRACAVGVMGFDARFDAVDLVSGGTRHIHHQYSLPLCHQRRNRSPSVNSAQNSRDASGQGSALRLALSTTRGALPNKTSPEIATTSKIQARSVSVTRPVVISTANWPEAIHAAATLRASASESKRGLESEDPEVRITQRSLWSKPRKTARLIVPK